MKTIARREVLAAGRVKGSMMAAHIRWVLDKRTPDEIKRFWSMLPAEVDPSVRGMILPIQWYNMSDLMAVDRTIVNLFGRGRPDILREIGAHSAETNLRGVYKVFTRASVHDFLRNAAGLHRNFQDFGTVAFEQTGARSAKMIHSGYTCYSPLFCESALGYYSAAVALHGVDDPSVVETFCQCRGEETCTFVIRWR
ncbi:MAG TPA: hypothetical protein VMS98_08295 [Thermoanaerobaculia bacterium]|nr:hypothetical protein [Thermoanaerobaculia bacterium]